ncbi:hypothetical protein C6503_20545 [Candidatus Poribacteria bacterium]|nr:MAG: hypothetical protein C6503_20545 [Candidatus Poribacteria bacterium]
MQTQNRKRERSPHSHKYAIHFDILPEISYLNEDLPVLIADLLPIFHGFPRDVWISEKWVDEGLDFCRVVFWVSAESPDAIKTFGNWFQAIFREPSVAEVLERLVAHALDEPNDAEVILTDWTRLAN